ncbi:MAG: CPBP family intramembrane metalloprotease [Ilumatobacter sp.]|nr:CPBP family intramembrane metalloprotease [Ilumatobacter sp.]
MPDRSDTPPAVIPAGLAIGTWSVGWIVGFVLVAPIVLLAMGGGDGDATIPQLGAASFASWVVLVGALFVASRRAGTGSFAADYAVAFRPVDLLGIPVGVATQLALVPLLYWPLRTLWSDTFSGEKIEERAQDLADQAGGWNTVLLVLVVVVGAPVVEELVYRGLLQRSVSAYVGRWAGLLAIAVWFALIHFSPVEYPGLFLAGVVFGAGLAVTGRLGPAIVTHAAFNATGLVVVLN